MLADAIKERTIFIVSGDTSRSPHGAQLYLYLATYDYAIALAQKTSLEHQGILATVTAMELNELENHYLGGASPEPADPAAIK